MRRKITSDLAWAALFAIIGGLVTIGFSGDKPQAVTIA